MIDKEARALFIYTLCENYTKKLLDSGAITEEQHEKINKRCLAHCSELNL